MGAVRLQDLILLLPALIFFVMFLFKRGLNAAFYRREIALMMGVALAVVILFHLPFLLSESAADYEAQFARFWKKGVAENYLGVFSRQIFVAFIYLLKSFTEAGFLMSIVGLVMLAFRRHRDFIFLFLWILDPLLFYGNAKTGTTPRFFLLILPPFFLAQGFVLAEFLTKGKLARAIALIMVGLVMFLSFGFIYPLVKFRHDHALLPEFCQWVATETEPRAVIVVTDENSFVHYYSRRETLARPETFGRFAPGQLDDFFRRLDFLLSQGRPVYIPTMAIFSYDRHKEFSTRLQENYNLNFCGRHLYEDWHKGEMSIDVKKFGLYKIEEKRR